MLGLADHKVGDTNRQNKCTDGKQRNGQQQHANVAVNTADDRHAHEVGIGAENGEFGNGPLFFQKGASNQHTQQDVKNVYAYHDEQDLSRLGPDISADLLGKGTQDAAWQDQIHQKFGKAVPEALRNNPQTLSQRPGKDHQHQCDLERKNGNGRLQHNLVKPPALHT